MASAALAALARGRSRDGGEGAEAGGRPGSTWARLATHQRRGTFSLVAYERPQELGGAASLVDGAPSHASHAPLAPKQPASSSARAPSSFICVLRAAKAEVARPIYTPRMCMWHVHIHVFMCPPPLPRPSLSLSGLVAVAELSEGALGHGLDLVARSVVSGGAALGRGLAQPLMDRSPSGQRSVDSSGV